MLLRPKTGFVLICVFLDALGIGLIIPVLPRLIGTLCASRDLQTWWYGAIMLSYGLMQFVSSPLLGALSDKLGRRPVLLMGILGLGLTFAVPAFCASLPLILASRILGGALSANTAVAQAYISDITQGKERTMMFGRLGAVFGIGLILGPAVGGITGQANSSVPFLIASVLALVNFLYGALLLPESLSTEKKSPRSFTTLNAFLTLPHLLRSEQSRPFFIVFGLTALANSLLQCTWALYAEFRYSFSPLEIGLSIFALGASISFIQGFALKPLLQHRSASQIIIVSLCASILCLLGMALTPCGVLAVIFCCAYSVGGTVGPILTSAISCASQNCDQGKNIGALNSLGALMGAIAPALGTPLLTFVIRNDAGILAGAPYFTCAFLVFCALFFFLKRGSRQIDALDKKAYSSQPY